MQVTQIYFTDNGSSPPPAILARMETVKRFFPNYRYCLYNLESARQFLLDHYNQDVLDAFETLVPFAYKSDFFRYCVLYKIGGWYFDCAITINCGLLIPESCNSVAFRDFPLSTNTGWAVLNSALFARPNHPVYKIAIDFVLSNCESKYYGSCNLCPTGPILLGRAFAMLGDDPANLFFNFIHLTPGFHIKNPALVISDGKIFAYCKNTQAGNLAAYGATGTNSYPELYQSRNIYRV
ncbi:MAG: glycosyltransferase family 32 protein [Fluviibacter phosphoraccumulans]